jgi:uncharacterized protein (TIGR02118 family)
VSEPPGGAAVYGVLLRRAAGVSRAEFLRAWLEEHRQLARELPGLREVRLLPIEEPAAGTDFDGLGLLFFGSRAELDAALAAPQALALRAHTATFADSGAALRMLLSDPRYGSKD